MPKPRPSVLKRQREQAKRDKKAAKAEKRAQRKSDSETESDILAEQPLEPVET
ncbi:MAG TPA: hypothetical protein VLU46_13640 [Thermoanaerobaculia bacterium]|nr:hypothetical protein [Thermoanaerobaculia bacterium]